MAQTLSLTNPAGWKRLFSYVTFGLWNPDKGTISSRPNSGGSTAAGVNVSDTQALSLSTVFSCIRLIAEACSQLPLVVYQRTGDGSRKRVPDHWLQKLIDRPNPVMTGQDMREALVSGVAGWGNGYAETPRNSEERPIELWPLNPAGMRIERDYDAVRYFYTKSGNAKGEQPLERKQLLHVRGFGTDGYIGLSPIGMAREALALTLAAQGYGASFFANGGKPSGVLMIDRLLQPDQRSQIREQFDGMANSGVGEGNRLWLLEANMKYQGVSVAPEDAQFLQTRQLQIAEIARYFRVPLHLIMEGSKDSNWGTGIEQQNLGFLMFTLQPYLTRVENCFNRWLLSEEEQREFYCEHSLEGFLRADSKTRAEFYSTMVNNGLLTRNEVRQLENRPALNGADDLTAQSALVPLRMLGQTAVPASPQKEERMDALLAMILASAKSTSPVMIKQEHPMELTFQQVNEKPGRVSVVRVADGRYEIVEEARAKA